MLAILGEWGANYASMEDDAASQEETDEKAVQDDQTKSEMDKAEQLKTAEMTTMRKNFLLQKVESMNSDKSNITKELDAVNQYLSDLQRGD